uniref:EOG090X0BGA n=1 Tax=Simocephalus serrulatus TaxID=117539 RepID=A0A4Y7NMG0_9CRUS|nr:EOG090X0BGA [Simocephalus serrulatus]SVE94440.1 EOG090X0BGA [Simocephalus serrulatus]
MFLPPTTALGAGLYSVALYGGLVLFSAFLLYDTQRIVHSAEAHSPYAGRPYDPVNASISIYLDTINIFVRIATILAGGNRKREVQTLSKCPGYYCGRHLVANGNETKWSACGSCPRGSRVNNTWACTECSNSPTEYDWMYLCFMVLIGLLAQWYSIDIMTSNAQLSLKTFGIHVSALIETFLSAIVTLLIHQPYGTLSLKSCTVEQLSDWYTVLHNPNPNYEEVLHCAQEAVYPLYSIVFVHYGISVFMLFSIRPLVNKIFQIKGQSASRPIYAALYLFPILALIHGIMAGLIYYSFPSIIILLSLMSHAFHFASRTDQSWRALLYDTVSCVHNLVVVVGHWVLHGFGLVALTYWLQPEILIAIITLVPLPTCLYIVLSRFTDPVKFHSD